MSESPPTYYALSRSERDHLLAASHLQGDDWLPNGQDIQRRVETIRKTDRPGNTTTYNVLDSLTDWGWISREHVNDKATGFRVTPAGWEVLGRAAREYPGGGRA